MKRICLILICLLFSSCSVFNTVPDNFLYEEIKTDIFTLASYQKIQNKNEVYKIYIEGDGFAFNHRGMPTKNPTPKSYFVRNLAFKDNNSNIVYLARPCQYILNKNPVCSKRHWTTARFAPEVVRSTAEAIKQIAKNNEVILIGYSGGAQVAGLVAVLNPDIKVKKIITIAGNLDHLTWTEFHKLPVLSESLNLDDYKENFLKIPQIHYVGKKDKNTLPAITNKFILNKNLIVAVENASHNKGWEKIYPAVWNEN